MAKQDTTYREWTEQVRLESVIAPIDEEDWSDEVILAAGFDPQDPQVEVLMLGEDWNGYPAGAWVVRTAGRKPVVVG